MAVNIFPKLSLKEQKEARAFARYSSSDFTESDDKTMFEFYIMVKEKRPELLEEFRYYKKQMPKLGEI